MARKPCSHSPWRKKEITQTLCTMGKEATNELTSYLWLTARVVESLKKKKRRRCSEKQPRKRRLSVFAAKFVASHLNGGGVNANHNVWTGSPSLAHKNKTENGEGNRDGEWKFRPGKDQKNLQSKLVDYSPKQDDQKQWTLKHRNKPNGSKSTNHKSQTMTFWTGSSKRVFPKRSAKMINGTKKPPVLLVKVELFRWRKTGSKRVPQHYLHRKSLNLSVKLSSTSGEGGIIGEV